MGTNQNNKNIFLPSGCLSEHGLSAWLSRQLTGAIQEEASKHLDDCALCSHAAKGLELSRSSINLTAINRTLHEKIDSMVKNGQTSNNHNNHLGPKGMLRYLRNLRNIAAVLPLMLMVGSVLWLTAALHEFDQRISSAPEFSGSEKKPETIPPDIEDALGSDKKLTPPLPQLTDFRIMDDEIIITDEALLDVEQDYILDFHPPVHTKEIFEPEVAEIFIVVEEPPKFPGGHDAMFDYLTNNLRYPPQAREEAAQGVVFLTFVIHEDGSVADVRVVRGVHHLLDAEALRVVGAMPAWTPGKQRGKPVKVQFTMPVKFTLK